MENKSNKHEHYELLNLLGYGLAKFNNDFIQQFGCKTKEQFYQYRTYALSKESMIC